MRENGFGAVLDRIMNLVLLQFLTRNMFRHKRSSAWIGTLNPSINSG
jgi:hypothetical protein